MRLQIRWIRFVHRSRYFFLWGASFLRFFAARSKKLLSLYLDYEDGNAVACDMWSLFSYVTLKNRWNGKEIATNKCNGDKPFFLSPLPCDWARWNLSRIWNTIHRTQYYIVYYTKAKPQNLKKKRTARYYKVLPFSGWNIIFLYSNLTQVLMY